MLDDFLTPKEAAQLMGLKYPAFMARVRKGQIPHTKKGWFVLIPKKAVLGAKNAAASTVEKSTR